METDLASLQFVEELLLLLVHYFDFLVKYSLDITLESFLNQWSHVLSHLLLQLTNLLLICFHATEDLVHRVRVRHLLQLLFLLLLCLCQL